MKWPWVRREGLRLLWMLIGALAAIGNAWLAYQWAKLGNVGFTVLHFLFAVCGLWFVWEIGTENERR